MDAPTSVPPAPDWLRLTPPHQSPWSGRCRVLTQSWYGGRMTTPTDTQRTTILLRPYDLANINSVSTVFGGLTNTEVIRRALELLAVATGNQAVGGKTILVDGDGGKTTVKFV